MNGRRALGARGVRWRDRPPCPLQPGLQRGLWTHEVTCESSCFLVDLKISVSTVFKISFFRGAPWAFLSRHLAEGPLFCHPLPTPPPFLCLCRFKLIGSRERHLPDTKFILRMFGTRQNTGHSSRSVSTFIIWRASCDRCVTQTWKSLKERVLGSKLLDTQIFHLMNLLSCIT